MQPAQAKTRDEQRRRGHRRRTTPRPRPIEDRGRVTDDAGNAGSLVAPGGSADLANPALYINRETSWLAFNARVLDQALDVRWPLLERLKFLAIYSSNLDEFFMIRVSGLHEQLEAAALVEASPDGLSAREQLTRIGQIIRGQLETAATLLADDLLPALAGRGHPDPRLERARRRHQEAGAQILPPLGVSGGDAAGGRPRAPLPVPVEPLAVAGGRGARPGDARNGSSRASRSPRSFRASSPSRPSTPAARPPRPPTARTTSCRSSSCWPPTSTSSFRGWRSWGPIRFASRATWTTTSSRTRRTICCRSSTARSGAGASAPACGWRSPPGSPSGCAGC